MKADESSSKRDDLDYSVSAGESSSEEGNSEEDEKEAFLFSAELAEESYAASTGSETEMNESDNNSLSSLLSGAPSFGSPEDTYGAKTPSNKEVKARKRIARKERKERERRVEEEEGGGQGGGGGGGGGGGDGEEGGGGDGEEGGDAPSPSRSVRISEGEGPHIRVLSLLSLAELHGGENALLSHISRLEEANERLREARAEAENGRVMEREAASAGAAEGSGGVGGEASMFSASVFTNSLSSTLPLPSPSPSPASHHWHPPSSFSSRKSSSSRYLLHRKDEASGAWVSLAVSRQMEFRLDVLRGTSGGERGGKKEAKKGKREEEGRRRREEKERRREKRRGERGGKARSPRAEAEEIERRRGLVADFEDEREEEGGKEEGGKEEGRKEDGRKEESSKRAELPPPPSTAATAPGLAPSIPPAVAATLAIKGPAVGSPPDSSPSKPPEGGERTATVFAPVFAPGRAGEWELLEDAKRTVRAGEERSVREKEEGEAVAAAKEREREAEKEEGGDVVSAWRLKRGYGGGGGKSRKG